MKKIILLLLIPACLIISCKREKKEGPDIITTPVDQTNPTRIISLAPAITEELFLLGVDNMLIANTTYCQRPTAAKEKMKIGSLTDFNLEVIVDLKPDLILCTNLANKKKIVKLMDMGINVTMIPPADSFAMICDNFSKLGKAVGKPELAEKIVADANRKVIGIKKLTSNLKTIRVFMQLGAKPLVTVSRDYFINDYIKFSGGINISEDSVSNRYSREEVLNRNPDVMIIVNMGILGEEEKANWMKFSSITAVKEKKIFIVDSDIFCNPTISTFMEALKGTSIILHPELKDEIDKIFI